MASSDNGIGDELTLDLDAFAPMPQRFITFLRKKYPVLAVLDLPMGDWLTLIRIDDGIDRVTDSAELLSRVQRKLAILVPTMPPDVVAKMSFTQALRAAAHAWVIAKGPQTAGGGEPGSSTGSPVSADSGAGGLATS